MPGSNTPVVPFVRDLQWKNVNQSPRCCELTMVNLTQDVFVFLLSHKTLDVTKFTLFKIVYVIIVDIVYDKCRKRKKNCVKIFLLLLVSGGH